VFYAYAEKTRVPTTAVKQCFAESDHLHNMPDLLLDIDNKERQRFYSETMRDSYLSLSSPDWSSKFTPYWEELDKIDALAP
jgi:hypothetical protein